MRLLFTFIKDIVLAIPIIINLIDFLRKIFVKKKVKIMTDPVKQDIHELKQLVALSFDIMIPIIKKRKTDGKFNAAQLIEFLNSDEFKADIVPAIKDIGELSAEVKDFGWDDSLDLVGTLLEQAKKIIAIYNV